MKYYSLDLETTDLIPDPRNILMLSLVEEDTEKLDIPVDQLPHFTCFIRHASYTGNAYALALNGWILDIISGRKPGAYPIYDLNEAIGRAAEWLAPGRQTVAGKNVAGFDLHFLPQLLRDRFRHRVLDPGPLFFRPKADTVSPDLTECKRRAGITTPVAHDARQDALDVIRCLRYAWST